MIPLLGDEEVDSWQDMATTAGEVLGRQDEAAALVTDAEQASADLLAELPGLEGATSALANHVPGDAIDVVADPDDGAGILFGQRGMEIDPELLAFADGGAGRVQLSLERIDGLDGDVLIMLTNGADTADLPLYQSLPTRRTSPATRASRRCGPARSRSSTCRRWSDQHRDAAVGAVRSRRRPTGPRGGGGGAL